MSTITHRRSAVVSATLMILLLACGTASAQRYGQNPAPRGVFVPLADGPVLAGTTGTPTATATSSANTSATSSTGTINLNNGMQLALNNGQLTLSVTQTANSGLFQLVSAFGDLDLSFVTMAGTQFHVQSTLSADAVTFHITFGNELLIVDGNPDATNSNSTPDANPVNNPNGGIDGSPGNPLGGT